MGFLDRLHVEAVFNSLIGFRKKPDGLIYERFPLYSE